MEYDYFKSKIFGLVGNEKIAGINPKLMKDIIANRHLLNEYEKWEGFEKFKEAIGERRYYNLEDSDLFEGWAKDYYVLHDINSFKLYIPKENPKNRIYLRTMIDGYALHKDHIESLGEVYDALNEWARRGTNLNFDAKFPANAEFIKKHPDVKIHFALVICAISKPNIYKLFQFCENHFSFEDSNEFYSVFDYDHFFRGVDIFSDFYWEMNDSESMEVKDLIVESEPVHLQKDVEKTPFGVLEERICAYVRMIQFVNELDCEYSITLRKVTGLISKELESLSNSDILVQYVPSKGEKLRYELVPTSEYGEKILDRVTMEWEHDVLNDLLVLNEEIKERKKAEEESKVRKPISGRVRQNVLMRDNYTCQICGATVKDGAKLEIDHILPFSKGGTNKENNLQVLCRQCNREKHNRDDLLHDKRKLSELEDK